MSVICRCGARAVQEHHVIYRQELRRRRGDMKDRRNLIPLCLRCHERHHSRIAPISLSNLPDEVFDFAYELMGPAAYDYLGRHYAGEDPRLDALIEAAA